MTRLYIIVFLLSIFAIPLMAQTTQNQSADTIATKSITVRVDGMACPFCAFSLEKKLSRIPGVQSIAIKINDGNIILLLKPGAQVDTSLIRTKVKEAGFTPRQIQFSDINPPPTPAP